MFLSRLAKLANIYDQMGQVRKADRLDLFITKWSQAKEEPSIEDLMGEEAWLKEEGITTDDGEEGETYFEEDPLEGLSDTDKELGSAFLNTAPDIAGLLKQLEDQKNKILQQLDRLGDKEDPIIEPEISNLPLTPEASLMKDLEKLANLLDEHKMHKHASFFDGMLNKLAQGMPPDDMFDETDADDLGEFSDEFGEGDLGFNDPQEPKEEDFHKQLLDVVLKLESGEFKTLEEAQAAARKVMVYEDSSLQTEGDFVDVDPDNLSEQDLNPDADTYFAPDFKHSTEWE